MSNSANGLPVQASDSISVDCTVSQNQRSITYQVNSVKLHDRSGFTSLRSVVFGIHLLALLSLSLVVSQPCCLLALLSLNLSEYKYLNFNIAAPSRHCAHFPMNNLFVY